jgi:quercetin dioxygenase-like cupin family protein
MSGYQVVTLDEVPDWLGDYPGEMRGITYSIGAEQVALTYRRMPQHTGSKGSYGHRHREQEELYLVLAGKLQFKLGDDIVEAARGTAIRVPPEVVRGVWNDEPEDAELVIVSKKIDDAQGDTEQVQGFWPAD